MFASHSPTFDDAFGFCDLSANGCAVHLPFATTGVNSFAGVKVPSN